MVERTISWEFIFIAGVFTVTIMTGIFFMGAELSDRKVTDLDRSIQEFTIEQRSQDLSRRIASSLPQNNCEALNAATTQTVSDIRDLRDAMVRYENSEKLENQDYQNLRKQYTNSLLEYWVTVTDIKSMCDSELVTILYFYGDDGECDRCQDQGVILTHYRRQYDERLLVFPMDTTLGMRPVQLIEDTYNIETYPSLIINGEKHEGYHNRTSLGSIIETELASINASRTDNRSS